MVSSWVDRRRGSTVGNRTGLRVFLGVGLAVAQHSCLDADANQQLHSGTFTDENIHEVDGLFMGPC